LTNDAGCPGIDRGIERTASLVGGNFARVLFARRALYAGLKGFAQAAAEGPLLTPEMTRMESEVSVAVHEEACLAVDAILRKGDMDIMRRYVKASQEKNPKG